jgi:streptogramin lyase
LTPGIGATQFEYWQHTQLIIDVVPGRGSGFSTEAPEGVRFLTRSRVFTDEEVTALEAAGPPARAAKLGKSNMKMEVKGDAAKRGALTALGAAGVIWMLAGVAYAETPIGVPDKSFPESVTSTKDGTLYVGSFNEGGVVKIAPGGKLEQLVKPGANGSRSTLGVLADEKSGTLYVCSNDLSGLGVKGPSDAKGSVLKKFDLKTGADKGSFALGEGASLCNDIVVGNDGTAYISDSLAPNIYSLKPGGSKLEVWATDPAFAPAKDGVGLDGIAIGADGNIYLTTYIPAKLFRVAVKDGKPGAVTELKPSRTLDHADAMRAFGDGFLVIEGAGRLDKVTVKGDEAQIDVIQDGLTEPVSVTQVGNTGWIAEGKLSYIIGPNKGKDPGPFVLKPVSLK